MVAELGLETGAEDGGPIAEARTSGEQQSPTKKKPKSPSTTQIITLMRRLVAQRLEQMTETPMTDGTEEQKLLEMISRTTTKLEALRKRGKETSRPPQRSSKAVLELRRQIADRIDQLNQG